VEPDALDQIPIEPQVVTGHSLAADLQDPVAGADARVPGGTGWQDIADDARRIGQAVPVGGRGENHREQNVHEDPGRDDQHPLRNRLGRVAARIKLDWSGGIDVGVVRHFDPVGFGLRVAGIVVLAEHLHVAAER